MEKHTFYFTEIYNQEQLNEVEKNMISCGAKIHQTYSNTHPNDYIIEALVPQDFIEKFSETKSY